jgi:hypothetical protein
MNKIVIAGLASLFALSAFADLNTTAITTEEVGAIVTEEANDKATDATKTAKDKVVEVKAEVLPN